MDLLWSACPQYGLMLPSDCQGCFPGRAELTSNATEKSWQVVTWKTEVLERNGGKGSLQICLSLKWPQQGCAGGLRDCAENSKASVDPHIP